MSESGNIKGKFGVFEWVYLFIILLYTAQMTPQTGRMLAGLSGNPIPLLIPIVLTAVLLFRNPVSFADKRLWIVISVSGIWSIASLVKYGELSTEELSYHFFLYYAIIIAYIHVKVFGKQLFLMYEKLMVYVCMVTLPMWLICAIFPSLTEPFFELFPETIFGHNFLYIFNRISSGVYDNVGYLFLRNAGFSWEPGRFAIMLCYAILVNIQRNGIRFKGNYDLMWLLLSLLSTQSTTGFSIVLTLYALYALKGLSGKSMLALLLLLPLVYGIFQLDFMYEKMVEQVESLVDIDLMIENTGLYTNKNVALDRLPSLMIEGANFLNDPLLGYGRNPQHSMMSASLPDNIEFTGGLMQMFSVYGIFIGLFYYAILFISSWKIGLIFNSGKLIFFVCTLMCLFSYPVFCIPIFTAFWFYGVFCDEDYGYRRLLLILLLLMKRRQKTEDYHAES